MTSLNDYRQSASLADDQYRAAVEAESNLKATCETSARTLLVSARDLGWGSGIPWYDALYWLQQAAGDLGIEVPTADKSADQGRRAIPRVIVRAVWNRDGWECVTCRSHRNLTIDHKVPLARGGGNDISNLQTMCQPCNSAKGDRVEVDL